MNVFKDFVCTKKYYLTHPFAFFKELKINLKNCRDRIVKGYCFSDIADFDTWLLTILPRMLQELQDERVEIEEMSNEDINYWQNIIDSLKKYNESMDNFYNKEEKKERQSNLANIFSDIAVRIHELWV